jgi:hypothetical protein
VLGDSAVHRDHEQFDVRRKLVKLGFRLRRQHVEADIFARAFHLKPQCVLASRMEFILADVTSPDAQGDRWHAKKLGEPIAPLLMTDQTRDRAMTIAEGVPVGALQPKTVEHLLLGVSAQLVEPASNALEQFIALDLARRVVISTGCALVAPAWLALPDAAAAAFLERVASMFTSSGSKNCFVRCLLGHCKLENSLLP